MQVKPVSDTNLAMIIKHVSIFSKVKCMVGVARKMTGPKVVLAQALDTDGHVYLDLASGDDEHRLNKQNQDLTL